MKHTNAITRKPLLAQDENLDELLGTTVYQGQDTVLGQILNAITKGQLDKMVP